MKVKESWGAYPLKLSIGSGLFLLNLLIIVLIAAVVLFPSSIIRIILGLPFVLFAPGYVLLAALFAKKNSISGVERVALSFGLSIAVVPLIGLFLNSVPWEITLESMLYSITSFVLVMSVIAWFKRKRLSKEERFDIEFQPGLPKWGTGRWDMALSIILVFAILGALGTLGYKIATPRAGEPFTEFYMLGTGSDIVDYPRELVMGEEGKVILGVINQEHEATVYRVDVTINDEKKSEQDLMELEHNEKWEGEVSFVPEVVSENQKVEFLLYKDGETGSYSSLRIWIDVK